jgi:hypothetical protein
VTFVGSITCKFEKVKTPFVKLSVEQVLFVGFDIDKSPLPARAGSVKSKKNILLNEPLGQALKSPYSASGLPLTEPLINV